MRETARATRGMVVCSHHLAAQSGLRVLRAGGNAIEAMIAAAATISVVYPHMNGVGGDGFWLIAAPGDAAPTAILGVGRAGRAVDADLYRRRGLDAIPTRGPLAANTVAGTVSSWAAAHEIAKRWGGTLPLEALLEDAIFHAREGAPLMRGHCDMVAAKRGEMTDLAGWNNLFLAGGEPAPGAVLKQPALAATLAALAREGLDGFYRGALARRIAADLARAGSPLTLDDLAAHKPIVTGPASVGIGAGALYNTPPPTQGAVSLAILALYDRIAAGAADGFDHVHRLVEATKQAFLIRDAEITDPAYMKAKVEALLAPEALDARAQRIDPARAMEWARPAAPGDTVWLGAIDGAGRAVSFIHSIYWEFGSGVVLGETGIQWQNRGCSFSLEPLAFNRILPGRLPFHTNNPAMARLADGRLMVYGTMGGDGQPQTQAAVFTRYGRYGQDLQQAIAAPRWLLGRTWGTPVIELSLESRFDPAVIERLKRAGHRVRVLGEYDALMGHAGAIVRHPQGLLEGAADPRGDGLAAAF
ncbi:MAG TPA: gamma-glutamyltransferase family protein [Alphaproteobacteria bacterium]|jgi:gamma-glutamyltranspeptidase/glutathione hydrolase